MKEGLPSDVLLSLEEDKEGNLWCATEEELYKFNPSSEKIINYPSRFFSPASQFQRRSRFSTQSEYLMYNTMKGILYFHTRFN